MKSFDKKIVFSEDTNCHEWNGVINDGGYGMFYFSGKFVRAHRFALFLKTGKDLFLNKDKTNLVDHICRNRKCVNTEHLRYVDYRKNNLENSIGICAGNIIKTNCPKGHSYSGINLRIRIDKNGNKRRKCMECDRIRHIVMVTRNAFCHKKETGK